jgi:hypothetical protein
VPDIKNRLLNGEAFIPGPRLVDSSGRALVSTPNKEPERVTAVKFLRTLADQAGGIRTPQGQAIHRAAGHMVKLYEELKRCSVLKDLSGEHSREKLEAAAEGIYNVMRMKMIESSGGKVVPDEWIHCITNRPEEAENYIHMATAALGGPVFIPPCTEEEAAECTPQDS